MNQQNKTFEEIGREIKEHMIKLQETNENLFDLSIDYRADKIVKARNNIYAAIRELSKVYAELNATTFKATAVPI